MHTDSFLSTVKNISLLFKFLAVIEVIGKYAPSSLGQIEK